MKRIVTLLAACLILLSACGSEPVEITNVATYENRQVELLDATYRTSEEGKPLIQVHTTFTNNAAEGLYLSESFAARAYQDNIEIDMWSSYYADDNFLRKIKDGQSLSVDYVFILRNNSPVIVQISTPTADEVLLAEKEYTK